MSGSFCGSNVRLADRRVSRQALGEAAPLQSRSGSRLHPHGLLELGQRAVIIFPHQMQIRLARRRQRYWIEADRLLDIRQAPIEIAGPGIGGDGNFWERLVSGAAPAWPASSQPWRPTTS